MLLCSLAMVGCATTKSATPAATAATPTPATAQPQGGEQAQEQKARRPGRMRGRKATAQEYYREVMSRASRRNVKVIWLHGPTEDGRMYGGGYHVPVEFREGLR